MLQLFFLLGMAIVLASIVINGWYAITRGRWEENPDGTKYWTGKIFNKFHYWLQRHTVSKVYYKDKGFFKEFAKIRGFFKPEHIVEFFDTGVVVQAMSKQVMSLLVIHAAEKGVNLTVRDHDAGKMIISLFKEVKEYKLHYMVRDPLGECITCMASFYGTLSAIFFYQIAVLFNHRYPTEAINALIEMPTVSKILLVIYFCISLAWMNEFINNINQKLKT